MDKRSLSETHIRVNMVTVQCHVLAVHTGDHCLPVYAPRHAEESC